MLDEFLNSASEQEAEKVEDQPQTDEPQGEPDAEGGAPTAPQNEPKHVPLAALESERKQRQDWKEKAIRFEEELKAARLEAQRSQQPQQAPQQVDPLQSMQQQIINERFNTSEMLVRQAHADADDKVNVFMEAARANPALAAALQQQRHPWKFAYDEGARMLLQKEFGSDPTAYREKVRAELMAEMQSDQPKPKLNLPQSLNGARSSAPRSAPHFTGPPSLDDILTKK